MKTAIFAIIIAALFSGCTSHNNYGECIGLDQKQDPKLEYRISVWNVAMGIIFIETVIAPILVVTDELECPVGTK